MLLLVIKKKDFFFQNFDFLWYFWHKSLIKILMPNAPQKVKILENKKKLLFKIKKKTFFIYL